jgi:phosphoglycerate dehydrogenase-like enzyme
LRRLKTKKIAGGAFDVFDEEPLDRALRALPNLLATLHIRYVSRGLARFYQDRVANICRWLQASEAVGV